MSILESLLRYPTEVPRWARDRKRPLLDAGVPWWNYKTVEYMSQRLAPGSRVFEYGSGGSTLWLVGRGMNVVSVENDPGWWNEVTRACPTASILLAEMADTGTSYSPHDPAGKAGFYDEYVSAIDRYEDRSFDLVIVDGRARVECVRHSIPKVRPDGLLLLDDSERDRYREAHALLQSWKTQTFTGLKPHGSIRHAPSTTVWSNWTTTDAAD